MENIVRLKEAFFVDYLSGFDNFAIVRN